jgi:hypothetical protein
MTQLPRILTIMGSGETAPTMTKTHRELFSLLPANSQGLLLDTPYGFQENAAELATRAVEYFKTSINADLRVAGLQNLDNIDPLVLERGLNAIDDCQYIFAGPGSPTYALRQWSGTDVAARIRAKLNHGGCVTFASAAALTLGRHTVPVYEIYKAGHEPYWLDGLDILSVIDLPVVVIPHYDNAEGGHHDTRFCYLGERRLSAMEEHLPSDVFVLGVDEHTALVIDLESDSARVTGKGTVTIRRRGDSRVYESGAQVALDEIRHGKSVAPRRQERAVEQVSVDQVDTHSLGDLTDLCEVEFQTAITDRDANAATRAILKLESGIKEWSADTLQSDETERAQATLRRMISKLGEFATDGLRDPYEVFAPLMKVVMELRAKIRAAKQYDLADLLRDELGRIGIEIRDTRDGQEWVLNDSAD